jgi:hypothetical protein
MTELVKILNNPEEHYPGNFDTPERANALLTGLCQDAATEIAKLQAEVERLKAPQPVPVKTYHDGKPWPVQPTPWVGLTEAEIEELHGSPLDQEPHPELELKWVRTIEAKLKEKNA